MANIVKYAPVNRDNGERVATNGYYTGHKKGTPTQAKDEVTGAYDVEEGIVRYGTMMGDAAEGSMPGIGVDLVQILTGCKSSFVGAIAEKGAEFKATYTADESYTLPTTITVKVGGSALTVTTDYTFASGVLTIPKAKVTGAIEVTVTATKS